MFFLLGIAVLFSILFENWYEERRKQQVRRTLIGAPVQVYEPARPVLRPDGGDQFVGAVDKLAPANAESTMGELVSAGEANLQMIAGR